MICEVCNGHVEFVAAEHASEDIAIISFLCSTCLTYVEEVYERSTSTMIAVMAGSLKKGSSNT